jgi:hypothetical protein
VKSEDDRAARKLRAEARRSRMTVELAPVRVAKPPPYANASPM